MNGILVVNKAKGMTSHDIVNQIRKIFHTKKVGHLGTLDPNATGVLVIAINEATKLVQYLENDSKIYLAEIIVGFNTDTYDNTGNIIKKSKINNLDEKIIDNCLLSFLGESMQVPPIYSAIKKDGKKLYEYARNNQEVEIPPRPIIIYEIKRISEINFQDDYASFMIKVHVSKGTYIRSLAKDIGDKLGIPCCMGNLTRIKSGRWLIEEAKTIDEIKNGNYFLYPMLEAVDEFPFVEEEDIIKKAKNGMKISGAKINDILGNNPTTIIIKENDNLIAIYHYDVEIKGYRAGRVWN